jgi:hypothetical protein
MQLHLLTVIIEAFEEVGGAQQQMVERWLGAGSYLSQVETWSGTAYAVVAGCSKRHGSHVKCLRAVVLVAPANGKQSGLGMRVCCRGWVGRRLRVAGDGCRVRRPLGRSFDSLPADRLLYSQTVVFLYHYLCHLGTGHGRLI